MAGRLASGAQSVGGLLLAIAVLCACVAVPVVLLIGVSWVIRAVEPVVIACTSAAFWLSLLVFTPASLLRQTRVVAIFGFGAASIVFGIFSWCLSFACVHDYFGTIGLVIGLLIAGVGIVPIAMVGAVLHHSWPVLALLIAALGIGFGTRVLAVWLATVQERSKARYVQKLRAKLAAIDGVARPLV